MTILVVGNVLKDVYLNLDTRTESFETDKHDTKWLDIGFNASEHHFFNRNSSLGGAAVSLEVLSKLGLEASISGSDVQFAENELTTSSPVGIYRYILVAGDQTSYLTPTLPKITSFIPPAEAVDYLYIDRSAHLDSTAIKKINVYLDLSPKTKLAVYFQNFNDTHKNQLLSRADLIFLEEPRHQLNSAPIIDTANLDPKKIIHLSENSLSYLNLHQTFSVARIDRFTHLSIFSIAAATILGSFILGHSVEKSLDLARINIENSKLNSTLTISQLQEILQNPSPSDNLELIAASLVLPPKGILAADESGGSIKKKFAQLNIPDTYESRQTYRNLLLTTPNLEKYINGAILFDETAHQTTDTGQNFVDYLTSHRIIPGIKVDQGLAKFNNSLETYTEGLSDLETRLAEYYTMGLRFTKWRAAFEIHLSESGDILTPTDHAIKENCRILAEFAAKSQSAGLVPIVEPEVVYDGYYSVADNATVTGQILDSLFSELINANVNLRACILKVNMILPGKYYPSHSSPDEIGAATATVLKSHIPESLAGVVFLSGGQTPKAATDNLASIIKHGPFPWPVTFSFARALQDPALYAWAGQADNLEKARQAFLDRIIANSKALY